MKKAEKPPSIDALIPVVAVKLRGVMGGTQHAYDATLVREDEYTRDRDAIEAAIRTAQAKLDSVGAGPDPKQNALELAWAYYELEQQIIRLARFEARTRLARRREALRKAHPER